MLYDRKIKYVHMYENGEKIQNVGFVKLEAVENKVNVHIHIAGLGHTSQEKSVVLMKGNGAEAILGEIYLELGKGSLDIKNLPAEQLAEGITYGSLQEFRINISGGAQLRCIIREICEEMPEKVMGEVPEGITKEESEEKSDENPEGAAWNTEELTEAELLREAFVQERRALEESAHESEMENGKDAQEEESVLIKASPRIMQVESMEETVAMAADKWQQLWALYPHMKPFEDEREFLVVKPRDFVLLQNKYYTLSANSFLLHGYYNYEHLILSKEVKREEEYFYIGVPGNFYEKEKQVAVLFGFESFEGKREPAGNGDFGYYMIPVEI